jgi:hypothetical protein
VVNSYCDNSQVIANKVFPVLGWWHPHKVFFIFSCLLWKMLAECIWKLYLPSVFGPFVKSYWPTTSILKKPKFQVLLKWYKVFLGAYSEIRHKIPSYRAAIPSANQDHLDYVGDLFEAYLPFILFFERTKNCNSFPFRCNMLVIQLFFLSALKSAPYVKV